MAAKKELFWLGVGVICIDGKDYGAGMPLPVSKIVPADLKKMIGDGRIGGMIEKIDGACKDCAGHLDTIQAKNILIEELKSEVERLTDEAKEAADLKAVHVKDHADKASADKTEKKDEKK